jgi:ribosomal protein L7Ae-like RNA K-turn-binding protein
MPQFVKYEMTEDMYSKVADLLQKVVKSKGKLKAGVNEVTKMIERGTAKLVVMAQDVSPEELLLHIPTLCNDKKIPYTYLKDRKALGEAQV